MTDDKKPWSLVTANDAQGLTRGAPHERTLHVASAAVMLALPPLAVVAGIMEYRGQRRMRDERARALRRAAIRRLEGR